VTRDLNDPQQLWERISAAMELRDCSATEAADFLYADMATKGYYVGPTSSIYLRPQFEAHSAPPRPERVEPTSGYPEGWPHAGGL
jgi:hypothetical protein